MVMIVKILKYFAGFFGSLLLVLGLMSGFLYFVTGNLVNNADNFDKVITDMSGPFLEQNREEIRALVRSKIEGQPMPKKEDLSFGCQHPNLVPENLKAFLTEDFCSQVDSLSQEEVDTRVFDYLIDTNINGLIQAASMGQNTQEVKTQIKELGGPLVNPTVLIGPILMFLTGALLIFASLGFSLIRSLYKIIFKLTITFITIIIFLLLIRFLSIDAFVSFLLILQEAFNVQLPDLGAVMLKFVVAIIIGWIRLAVNPLLLWVILISIPFIAASILLYIKQRNLSEEAQLEIKNKDEEALTKAD